MAYFAEIDVFNIVTQVIKLNDEDTQDSDGNEVESIGAEYLHNGLGGTWVRTSYNTNGGIHSDGGTPFRKNYAGIGFTYDSKKDVFYSPQPFPSWKLGESSCIWKPPVPCPYQYESDGGEEYQGYTWNEDTQSWDEREI